MPTTSSYQKYLPNIYSFSSGVQISTIASSVHVQHVDIQFNCPFWLPLLTNTGIHF